VADEVSDNIVKSVREEFARYIDREFDNREEFQRDLKLSSDDLTAIALEIERRLDIKIDSHSYRNVNNIESYVQLIRRYCKNQKSATIARQRLNSVRITSTHPAHKQRG